MKMPFPRQGDGFCAKKCASTSPLYPMRAFGAFGAGAMLNAGFALNTTFGAFGAFGALPARIEPGGSIHSLLTCNLKRLQYDYTQEGMP